MVKKISKDLFMGVITRIIDDKGYGFISGEDKRNIFFHTNDLIDVEFEKLNPGDVVQYKVIENEKGFNALEVKVVK